MIRESGSYGLEGTENTNSIIIPDNGSSYGDGIGVQTHIIYENGVNFAHSNQELQMHSNNQQVFYYTNNNNNNNNNINKNAGQMVQLITGTNRCDLNFKFEYSPPSSEENGTPCPDAEILENVNHSDASTVDINDPGEGPFQYLQGLNSDNLMRFSQQSMLQDMILKEQLIKKPNLNVLPRFEEHDIGGYNFQLSFGKSSKGHLFYSEALNKVYIKRNETLSVDVLYKPKLPLQQLHVRALMCFHKEISEPVLRCQNHISNDQEPNPVKRHSLLRCENPLAEYWGTADGKSINDRYSVMLPLNISAMPQEDKSVKETIALKLTCQNSCFGRKETSIIFLLEGMNGKILSQRILNIKVCSCPKRDRSLDERHLNTTVSKRKIKLEDGCPRSSKVLRQNDSSETFDTENDRIISNGCEVQVTPSGTYRVVMEVDTKEIVLKTIDYVRSLVAQKIVTEPNLSKRYLRKHRIYNGLYDEALKM